MSEERFAAGPDGAEKPWLFPQLVQITRRWLDGYVTADLGVSKGNL